MSYSINIAYYRTCARGAAHDMCLCIHVRARWARMRVHLRVRAHVVRAHAYMHV